MTAIESISSALHEGDITRLAHLLDTQDASFDDLDAMIRRDVAMRHLALLHLERRLSAAVGRATLERFARLLPATLDNGPELAAVLARLYRRLSRWGTGPFPDWRAAGLPVAIEVEWLRTELTISADVLVREPLDERLLQALEPDTLAEVNDPVACIRALAGRHEEPLQRLAVDHLRRLLHRSRLLPVEARALLMALVGSPHDDVASAVLLELSEPWSLLLPPPGEALTAQLARPGVFAAALECAARWRLEGPIRGAMDNSQVEPRLRQRAMELAGTFARRQDVGIVISVAASDPLLFGPPLLRFLRAQHRLGHFVADEDTPSLARVCLSNDELDAGEVATLVFPARQAFVAELVAADAGDPSWVRRARLLVALARGPQGATPLTIGPTLEAVLRSAGEPRVRRALIQAIGEMGYLEGEAAVLAHLEAEPQAVLGALRAIGDRATIDALMVGMSRVPLRPFRDAALSLAWHLSEHDPEARATLRGVLARGDVPKEIEASLGTRASSDELALLQGALRDATASYYLRRVAAVAGPTEWALICDLLLRLVSELATGVVSNEAARTLPQADRDALEAMGRRLHRAGCIRPHALLDAKTERAAGPLLVSAMVRELLGRTDLTEGETAVLLRTLDPAVDRRVFPAIHRMLRWPEPELRKLVVALLARDGADELLANLTMLTEEDDIETVRQAILAIGALGARGGASVAALTRCLDHRNMNIKKAAAEALATAGGPAAVTKLMFWLGYHDNPGFRASIIAALRAILGRAYAATIVASLASPDLQAVDEARRQGLLIEALGGELAGDDALALCRRDEPFAARLRQAIVSSELSLKSGDRTSFVIALDAEPAPRKLHLDPRDPPAAATSLASLVAALAANGFQIDAARAVLVASRLPGARWTQSELAAVRRFWIEWCARIDDVETPPAERAAVVVLLAWLGERARPACDEQDALARRTPALLALLGAEPGKPVEQDVHDAALDLLASIVTVLPVPARLAIAAALRALPERPNLSGRDPFVLLRACGAVVVRGDVDRALRAARRTSDPAAIERRVLGQMFAGGTGPLLPEAARRQLEQAARQPRGTELAKLREQLRTPAGTLIDALVNVYVVAHETNRPALVDWMEALQPLGAPRWTLAERAAEDRERRRVANERRPRATDLDQPRSRALYERLEAMLDAPNPEQRHTAAVTLLNWPEPATREVVADAYLRGVVELTPSSALAAAVAGLGEARIHDELHDADARPVLLRLLPHAPDLVGALAPVLLDVHDEAFDNGDADTCRLIVEALQTLPGDTLLVALTARFARGDFRLADVVTRRLHPSPELEAAIEHARREGRDWLVERWRDLEIRPPSRPAEREARGAFASAVAEMRTRSPAAIAGPRAPTRDELLRDATSGNLDAARRALTVLAREPDPTIVAMLHHRLGHAHPRMRLHAHRLLRGCETREAYLEATMRLLADPIDDVRRTAIRSVSFGRFAPAVPALVELLVDRSPVVRRAAEEALVYLGEVSRGALRHAVAGARPDRRSVYQRILDRLDSAADDDA